MDLLEEVSIVVLLGDSLLGVKVRVRNLSSFTSATHFDTHQKRNPDGRDNARYNITISHGQEETLDARRLGGQEVVKRRDRRSECGEGDALRHVCKMRLALEDEDEVLRRWTE